jgi:hypothetical protein
MLKRIIATVPALAVSPVGATGTGGTPYFYVVVAVNSTGSSGPSNEATGTTR